MDMLTTLHCKKKFRAFHLLLPDNFGRPDSPVAACRANHDFVGGRPWVPQPPKSLWMDACSSEGSDAWAGGCSEGV